LKEFETIVDGPPRAGPIMVLILMAIMAHDHGARS